MTKDELRAALFQAVQDTLETMAFAEVRPYDESIDGEIDNDVDFLWGKVHLDTIHDLTGVEFCLPDEFAQEMADTMYAGMIEIEQNAVMDTVSELTNTLAGSFLLSFGEKAGKFVLSVPESGIGKAQPPASSIVCCCIVDEIHLVRAVLFFD